MIGFIPKESWITTMRDDVVSHRPCDDEVGLHASAMVWVQLTILPLSTEGVLFFPESGIFRPLTGIASLMAVLSGFSWSHRSWTKTSNERSSVTAGELLVTM